MQKAKIILLLLLTPRESTEWTSKEDRTKFLCIILVLGLQYLLRCQEAFLFVCLLLRPDHANFQLLRLLYTPSKSDLAFMDSIKSGRKNFITSTTSQEHVLTCTFTNYVAISLYVNTIVYNPVIFKGWQPMWWKL